MKDAEDRLREVVATITARDNGLGNAMNTYFFTAMDLAQRSTFSALLSQGFGSLIQSADETTERKYRRAILALELATGPANATTRKAALTAKAKAALLLDLNTLVARWQGRIVGRYEFDAVWGQAANCYAYAADFPAPQNASKGAQPGAEATGAHVPTGQDAQVYAQAVANAAVSDGMTAVGHGTLQAPPQRGSNAGNYLVALFTAPDGFHWIRRDEVSGRWSWKDGNGGHVQKTVADGQGAFPGYPRVHRKVLDADLPDLAAARLVPWGYATKAFHGFFWVPNGGITVRGTG